MTKAKQILISEERKIRYKAKMKQYEVDKLFKDADELKKQIEEME